MTPITREQARELAEKFGDEATVMFSVKNLVAIFDEMADLRAKLEQSEARRLELEGIRTEAAKMADDYLEMISKLAQSEKDAARYRWLRLQKDGDTARAAVRCLNGPYFNNPIYGEALDAAIDAALNKEPGHEA